MKLWLTRIALGLSTVAAVALTACEDDDKVTLSPNSAPTLAASTNAVVLSQANSTQTAVTYTWTPISGFTWNGADNKYDPKVTYSLQIDRQNNNFASPVSIAVGTAPTALTVGALNGSLTTLGLTPGTATPLQVRLVASYAANAPMYSPVVNLTATTYKECVAPTSDTWAIIGPAGVSWDTDVPLTYDCDLKAYTLTRDLKADKFKFRSNKSWDVNYGDNGADGTLESGGADISVPTAGNYTITFRLTPSPTYTLKKN